jgi:imidazolonepropionase-like amidohydrolase
MIRPKRGSEVDTKARRRAFAASLSALVIIGLLDYKCAEAANASPELILNGVTIVDTHTGKLTHNVAIVVDGDKIVRIVHGGTVKSSASAQSIDAHGKYVVPGYLDMHTHTLNDDDPNQLALLLANGVTGFRQMSGSPAMLESRRQGKWGPSPLTPELLAMPGTILAGPMAATPELAIAEVQRQKSMGADFIKFIDVPPAAFFAAVDEATKLGLPSVGHLPTNVNVWEASKHGMRSIEHLGPIFNLLLGCSTDEAALRQSLAQKPHREPPIVSGAAAKDMIARVIANPMLFLDPTDYTVIQQVMDTYSESKCRTLAAAFVAHGTWQVPTLIRIRTMEVGDDPAYMNDPNLRYVPAATRQMWEELGKQFSVKLSPAVRKTYLDFFALQLKLVKLFQQTGVKMLAGSDSGGEGEWDISGFSIHQEFDLLQEAGLSPLEVLQMTTLNGAIFLGRESTMGSVEVGKDANLVLLDANPIASIQNLHKINAVVRGGTYQSGDVLTGLLKNVATSYSSSTVPVNPNTN